MEYIGNLLKMQSKLDDPVSYFLTFDNKHVEVNDWLGKEVVLEYQNEINCIHCGRKTSKSFFQGYCYPCFTALPQTDVGVLRPELNEAHNGISRDMEWSKQNDLIDHYVYLAATSNIKVGVTRHTQLPTRWIDQGAEYAIVLAKTPYRQLAGAIEVILKQHVNDKTNWRKMLSGHLETQPDLFAQKQQLAELLPLELKEYVTSENEVTYIRYPIEKYPVKIKSITLDKNPGFSGKLTGIKGQYLIFDNNHVFNVRKHNGYKVKIKVN